jgi:hypothetical protein
LLSAWVEHMLLNGAAQIEETATQRLFWKKGKITRTGDMLYTGRRVRDTNGRYAT